MLISKSVEITADWSSVKKYEDLGYGKMKQGDIFFILVEHLGKCSKVIVEVQCDFCKKIFQREYYQYIRNIKKHNLFSCLSCTNNKYKITCMQKYGVENISQLPETHEKIKHSSLERYGVTSYTKLEKFKDDHRSKMVEKYGVDSFSKTEEWLEKQKISSIKKFGVENASQSKEVFSKQQQKRFKIQKYKDTELYYQGSYEKDFLDNFYERIKIETTSPINYIFEDKNKVYFPDFYLPEFNLILEVKSTYTFNKHYQQNISKKEFCLKSGFNFLFIIDKNYSEIESIIY